MSRRRSLFASAGLMLFVLCGCGAASPGTEQELDKKQPGHVVGARSVITDSDDPGIDFQCVANRIRQAPVPFHWSYKKEVIGVGAADWEADISPNAIAGTFIDSTGTHAIRGVRSDGTSWDSAVMTLAGPLPASTFALVSNSSPIVRSGVESENGQDAIKYTFDTTQATGGKGDLIKSVLGVNGSIKGTTWVTSQGCPVRFILDVEQHNTEGTIEREHHEANITKP